VMTISRAYVNAAEAEVEVEALELAFGPMEQTAEQNAVRNAGLHAEPSGHETLKLVDVHYFAKELPGDAVAVADTGGKQIKTRIILQGKQVVMGNPLRSGENVAVNTDSL